MKQSKKIDSGPFKGKKIELASTAGVDGLREISEEFMQRIFDFSPGDYLITDGSSLREFVDVFEPDLKDTYKKIRLEYGFDMSYLSSGNLLEIFMEIGQRRSNTIQ